MANDSWNNKQFLYTLYSYLYQILIRDQMKEFVYNRRSDTCIRGSDIYKLPQLFSGLYKLHPLHGVIESLSELKMTWGSKIFIQTKVTIIEGLCNVNERLEP
jgi:hypothetical protein